MYSAKFLKTLKTINYQHYTLESISGIVENFFHSKGTRRALGHLGTQALGYSSTRRAFRHSRYFIYQTPSKGVDVLMEKERSNFEWYER